MKSHSPIRKPTRFLLWALTGFAALAFLLAATPRARAETIPTIHLLPSTRRGFVELAALNVNATLQCPQDTCSLEIEQVYQFRNRDRLRGAQVGVILQGAGANPVTVSFSPQAGASPVGPNAWTLRFESEGAVVVRVQYTAPLESQALARWRWDAGGLAAWGALTSARVELRLPWAAPEDLLLSVEPPAHRFDGRILHWEYEQPPTLGPFQVWLVAPPLWARAEALRQEGQHLSLAALYRELGREAARLGAPYPDPYPRVLAELQMAVRQQPSPEAHIALSELYLERAAALPELAYNYRLLATEELEAALEAGGHDAAVSQRLAEVYFELAQQARRDGNHAEAWRYIELVRKHAPDGATGQAATIEEIKLAWAIDLASAGRVSEALVEAAESLSPRVHDALYRYAPPIVAARTHISLTAQSRSATYRLYLYAPLADQTVQRLQELAVALNQIPSARAELTAHQAAGDAWVDLVVEAQYADLADLARISQAVIALGGIDPDLPHALIAAPWHTSPDEFAVWRTGWVDLYTYRETPTFQALASLREEQAQFTVWRLVEVANSQPQQERDRLEQQLTALALREQLEIWENLSASSFWSYHVAFPEPSDLATVSWLVGWGQERPLEIEHRFFWWRRIAEHVGLALGTLTILVLLVTGIRRLAGRGRSGASSG